MQYRRRLRSRLIVSFGLLGFTLTAGFALATVLLRERLEDQLIGKALLANVGDYAAQFYQDPNAPGIPFERISGRVFSLAKIGNVPDAWRDLPNGVHEVVEPGPDGRPRVAMLAVRKDPDYWFFLRYEIDRERTSQRQLGYALMVAVLLFSVLSVVLGWWSSRRVLRPVSELARHIGDLRGVGERGALAPRFADDEVGQLAQAFDAYADRLTAAAIRDREFNADVSHELRTPLAVIRGAAELLLAKPGLDEKTRLRLQRIERAAQQCTDLTTALLMLSRNERGRGHTDLRKLCEHLAEANRAQIVGKPVLVVVQGEEDAYLDAPEAVLAVALGNLIGNACKYTVEGEVRIDVSAHCIRVLDTGPGLSREDAEHLFERGYRGSGAGGTTGGGIGLSIVRRLCDLYGWAPSVQPRDEGGAIATLDFRSSQTGSSQP